VFDDLKTRTMTMLTPVLKAAAEPVEKARNWAGSVQDMLDVYEENKRLRAENAALKSAQDKTRAVEYQLQRYKALLNVRLDPPADFVTARVIGDSGGPFMRSFIVTAGAEQGVTKGQGAVDTQGLIGRVVAVGPQASRILLLSDPTSRVPVLVLPGNYQAIVVGDNSDSPSLKFLGPGVKVKAGDRIITSGDGGYLPPGLPVGCVADLRDEGDIVRVDLDSDFGQLDFVRVLKFSVAAEVGAAPGEAPMPVSRAPDAPGAKATESADDTDVEEATPAPEALSPSAAARGGGPTADASAGALKGAGIASPAFAAGPEN
jgi:rod shape-determining protein MreC